MTETVILSPHFDDAVLNCWHPIVNDNAVVMTVFSGLPEKGTRKFWDMVCGQSDSYKMMVERRRENELAVSSAGSQKPQLHLDYLDNQYRTQNPDIENIIEDVLDKSPKNSIFLAPLAGSHLYKHPDHVIARKIGIGLHTRGKTVYFYPDSPYTTLPKLPRKGSMHRIENAAAKLLKMPVNLQINPLNENQRLQKIQAMKLYRTQYKMTNLESFGGLDRIGRRSYEILLIPN